jgi:hypothetical protein
MISDKFVTKYSIEDNGIIITQLDRVIFEVETGEEIAKQTKRISYEPGQDLTGNKNQKLIDISKIIWTDEVIRAYQDAKKKAIESIQASITGAKK